MKFQRLLSNMLASGRVLFLICFLAGVAVTEAQMEAQLSFSGDGGETYLPEPPKLTENNTLLVRLDWDLSRESRPIKDKIVMSKLRSTSSDFASALTGRQTWDAQIAWYQRVEPGYFSSNLRSIVYPLSLGKRAEGVMGRRNLWDKASSSFVDGPLPEFFGLSPGRHAFEVELYYRLAESDELVRRRLPFEVEIQGRGLEASAVLQKKEVPASASPVLPVLGGIKHWEATGWQVRGEKLKIDQSLLRPTENQDVSLRLQDFVPGNYYLRLLVESGKEQRYLNQPLPFVFLNGTPVPFQRAGPETSYRDTYVSVIESQQPVALAQGDELRWNSRDRSGQLLGGVALAETPLEPAPNDIRPFSDPDVHDVFRVSGEFKFPNLHSADEPNAEDAARGLFQGDISNLSGRKGEFAVTVEVRDFWQNVLAREEKTLSIEDRETTKIEVRFPLAASDRYRAIVRVKGPERSEREIGIEQLVDSPRTARPKMWLNDRWQWTSFSDEGTRASREIGDPSRLGPSQKWQGATLPHTWTTAKPKDPIAWYRRTFDAPAWREGRRVVLHFDRVVYETRIFLNGRGVGSHFGDSGPFELDVTDSLQPGSNELLLGVRGGIATLEPSELDAPVLDLKSPAARKRAPDPRREGLGEVWIFGSGREAIRDVFVQTSVKEKSITIEVAPPKLPSGAKRTLTNRVLSQGREVLHLPAQEVTDSSRVVVKTEWKNPVLWSSEDPQLLQLVTEWKDEQGRVLDRLDTRFGFREFRAEGTRLLLNGIPVKLPAIPFLSTWSWNINEHSQRNAIRKMLLQCRRLGVGMQRHIYDPGHRADINDEEGVLMVQGGSAPAGPTRQKVESNEFWKHAAESDVEMVRGMRNHPSIVTWYLSNEFYGADEPANRERLQSLGKAVRAVDPTRIIEFGCDLDLGGASEVISLHYPVDVRALREEAGVLPEAAYWRRFGETFTPGDQVPKGIIPNVANVRSPSPATWGKKPLVINETLWNFFFAPPDGLTRVFGDAVYRSAAMTERAYQEAGAWFIRGHRDAEASVITPWEHIARDPLRRGIPAIAINPLQRYARFFAGQKVPYDVNLHWDLKTTATLHFSWSLQRDGKTVTGGERSLEFLPSALHRERVEVTMPDVTERTAFTLCFELREKEHLVRRFELPVEVFPQELVSFPEGVRMALFDPLGKTREVFEKFEGQQPKGIEHLNEDALRGVDVLILGEGASSAHDLSQQRAIDRFLSKGGRALALSDSSALLPVFLEKTALDSNTLWTFRPGHPLLRGLAPGDFADWFPDNVTGHHLFLKPEMGNCLTVLESGGPRGMLYSAMIEWPIGEGTLVASQLDLIQNANRNPVAAQILQNALDYLATPQKRVVRVGLLAPPENPMALALRQQGAGISSVTKPDDLKGLCTVLFDAEADIPRDLIKPIQKFVRKGGILLIHGVTPENAERISLISESAPTLSPAPASWDGRGILQGSHPMTAGLTNYDFFWKRRPTSENYEPTFFSKSATLSRMGAWALEIPGGIPLLYPAYLVVLPFGKGAILFDNVDWTEASGVTRPLKQRFAATVLSNLGVPLQPSKPITIPEPLDYEPVNLSSVLNRDFTDPVAEDGKGGWSDQGPGAGLESFPTDKPLQVFEGIPFRIEKGPSVLTLASKRRPAGPPESVELPIHGRADALFFLQSCAWTNANHHASLIAHYTDGSQYEIKLIAPMNLRDWGSSQATTPFSGEVDTLTRHAWKGISEKYDSANLYLTAWPNPHPERDIQRVTFKSMNEGVPMLVAATIGRITSAPSVQPAGDTQAAQQLTREGIALLAEGKTDLAEEKFNAAMRADPRLDAPVLELAHAYELKQDWNRLIPLYKTFLDNVPDHLEIWFRLGKAHEAAGHLELAEKTYRHALDLNTNQPAVLESLNRVVEKQKKDSP